MASNINNYNTITGAKLSAGQSYTNASGQIVTQGTALGNYGSPLTSTIVTPPTTPISSANLQVGSKGQSVGDLQTYLNTNYNAGLKVDNQYGLLTDAAVKAYQKSNGLTADGIVGTQTAGKINGSSTSNIASTDITNKNTPITNYVPPATNATSILNSIQAGTASLADIYKLQTDQAAKNQTDITKMYSDLLGTKPSSEQLYNDALAQSGKEQAQRDFNNLSSQITGITADAQTKMQILESQAGGKGVTSSFLGRQQQEISRQAAIQALPLSAQLQSAQGNLQMATENLNTLYQIKSADAQSTFDYKVKLVDSLAQYATTQQKSQMDYIIKAEERAYQEKKTLLQEGKDKADLAFTNGQSLLGSQIMSLDSNSPTYGSDLARLTTGLKDPVRELDIALKKSNLYTDSLQQKKLISDMNGTSEAPKVTSVNGVDSIWDGKKYVPAPTNTSTNIQKENIGKLFDEKLNQTNSMLGVKQGEIIIEDANGVYKIQDVNGKWRDIPGGKGLAGTTGVIGLSRTSLDFDVITGVRSNFIANVNQITNQATIDNLVAVKKAGGTFGALSEKELGLLEQSASKIGTWAIHEGGRPEGKVTGYETTDANMVQEIAKLQMHLRNLKEADTGTRYTPQEEPIAADSYILNDVGNALQVNNYGNYQ